MALTHDDIARIALLARIGVTDAEVEQYRKELSSIVAYFDQLRGVPTDTVDDIGHITGMTNVMRGDVVDPAPEDVRADIMRNVSHTRDGQIVVKSIL